MPVLGEGVDEETSENIFIEGDNLEVLKLLQKSYSGRIKMIYIDPPYNTGNDLVYKDNFSEPLDAYLKKTQQMGEGGELLTTNTKAGGRFHSNWLNMIYPRLRVARNLLRDDGVIFVSIDDNEVHNLRQLMNEIFGEENFVDCIIWQKKVSPSNDAKWFSSDHDYLVVYSMSKDAWRPIRLKRSERQTEYYKNPDNDPRGPWNSATYTCNKSKAERPNLYYPIKSPTGEEVYPKETAVWAYSRELNAKHIADNRLYWGADGKAKAPRMKLFLSEARDVVPRSIWPYSEVGHTQEATREFTDLIPEGGFNSPKPTRLIKKVLKLSTGPDNNDIVLDFFAGSGSTADAVMQLNAEEGGNRRYICVQLPEAIDPKNETAKAGFKHIAEITKERIRRARKRIAKQLSSKLSLGGIKLDLGFRVFKLGASNFSAWNDYKGDDFQQLETLLSGFETPLVKNWREQDVLTEILLMEGFPLSSRLLTTPDFTSNKVIRVESDFSAHRLFICLDPRIKDNTIERLGVLPKQDIFICLDSALDDSAKVRLNDVGNVRTI